MSNKEKKFRISFEAGETSEDEENILEHNKSNIKGSNFACVPVINIQNESMMSNDNNNNINISNHKLNSSLNAETYCVRDISSTTNLLDMNKLHDDHDDDDDDDYDKHNLDAKLSNNKNLLNPNLKINAKNSSQSSIDSSVNKFGVETDMIPLMPINLDSNPSPILRNIESSQKHSVEKWYIILLQVIFPFFIAGFGMVGAGVVLDKVQHWDLYKEVTAIFTLIPALLGLKGNLEMTLASRFSTQVNLGKIKDKSTILSAVLGNFSLTQAQAIIVGFLASVGATLLKYLTKKNDNEIDFQKALVLISGCISTASFASLILAGLMMFIIIVSKKININPDNIATPIAASLGDLVTLSILTFLCSYLYQIVKYQYWLHIVIIVSFLFLIPIFFYYAYNNEFVNDALFNGWVPILSAMVISSTGGFIMEFAIKAYEDIAVFQPVVNGVGGNLVAIFASRLSTALHKTSNQGSEPYWAPKKWYMYIFDTFFGKLNPESNTGLILAFISVPGHLIFYFIITRIKLMQENHLNEATLTVGFVSFYTSVSILQVILLLLICYWLVHLAWRKNQNPDNVCIPYLTAIGDLLGTAFLAICFHGLYLAGEKRLRKHE